ncbi:D-3-phosphoglycerate dehydrogenase [Clostridia bacterium]|nr:D-3-phosphoglycerate dehydrogenase [Clostridia bacterium]
MYTIKCVNKIAKVGLKNLAPARFVTDDGADNPHGLLVRSAKLHDTVFGDNLLAIARAGAGVNNIPVADCAKKGIVVFNTPGANANAVRELTIGALILASRDLLGGLLWAKGLTGDDIAAQVEKGKSAFAGPEIDGKTLGIIGLGAIGVGVANAAHHLGMEVIGYDPFISVDAAWGLSRNVRRAPDLKTIYAESDYITIHVPLNKDTRGFINAETLGLMKDGVRIINLARGELVNDADMLAALDGGKAARYVTDFPNAEVINNPKVVPLPHLGASTPESEDNCAVMAAKELSDFLLYGNIRNSVNFPDAELPVSGSHGSRVGVLHENIPNVLSSISGIFGSQGQNVDNMINKSRGEFAYTLMDTPASVSDATVEKLKGIPGVIRVRVIANDET